MAETISSTELFGNKNIVSSADLFKSKDIVSSKELLKNKSPWWEKTGEFLTGHFGSEEPPPEIVNGGPNPVYGKDLKNVPAGAESSFLQDPVTALSFGVVGGALKAGSLATKAMAGASETAGWLTGGASDVPKLVTGAGKGIVKAVESKNLLKLREAREASGMAHATVPVSAETGKPVVESVLETSPKVVKTADLFKMEDTSPIKKVEPAATSQGKNVATADKTGTRKEITEKEIAGSGRPEVERPISEKLTPDDVKLKVDSGEINPRSMAEDISKKPRALSADEFNALGYDRAILNNEHARLESLIDNARAKGDVDTELKLLDEQAKVFEHQKNNDTALSVGQEQWGRSGLALQNEIAQDYSFSRMIIDAEKRKGRALTIEERQKYKVMSAKITELDAKIAQREAKIAAFESQKTFSKIKNDIALEQRKIKRVATRAELDAELDGLFKELNSTLSQIHANPVLNPDIYRLYGNIAKNRVKAGFNTMEGLIDEVYTIGKNYGLTLTKREVSDAISKYGVVGKLSKDEINVQLRELRRQMRLTSALEDASKGITPLRSGLLRDKKTTRVLELEKQVKDAMRKNGIDTSKLKTKEEQWKTATDSLKTRLKTQIDSITKQMETGEKAPIKHKTILDEEAHRLSNTRDFLKEQLNLMEGKTAKGLSDEQRINTAIKNVEKSITEYTRRITNGEMGTPNKVSTSPTSPQLNKLKQDREFLKTVLDYMKNEAKPKKDPVQIALQSFKTRTTNRIAELEKKMATGDFKPKERKELQLDSEALALKFKKDKVVKEYQKARIEDTLARRSFLEKSKDNAMEVLNVARAIKTSMDLSAVLRQGAFIALGHPIRGIKAMPDMFRALRSEKGQFAVEQSIMKRANYSEYEKAGLYLSEHGQKLSQMEEAYMSHWADKIPGVAASGRAYTTYLNVLRADSFDAMLKNLPTVAGKATPEEAKAIANFINIATGRGNLGAKENSLVALNTVFFAPRYVASRFQLMLGTPLKGGTWTTKKMIAKEYTRFFLGLSAVYGIAIAMGAKVGVDPRSSDYGKIKFGNTRIDPMAGMSQCSVLLGREILGAEKKINGHIVPIRERAVYGVNNPKVPYKGDKMWDVTGRFLRSKFSPVVGTTLDAFQGEDVVGNKVEPIGNANDFMQGQSVPSKLVMPLALSDIYQTMQEQGIPKGTAMALLSIFGMGIQTYNKKQ